MPGIWCRIVLYVLIGLIAGAWIFFHHYPMLLWATGYPKRYAMEPLKQIASDQLDWPQAGQLGYFELNWDGEYLFIDGNAGLTEAAYAPHGSFIIAGLPHGIGFAWRRAGLNPYDKMEGPHVLPFWCLILLVMAATFAGPVLRRSREQRFTSQGRCCKCGYMLKGLTEPRCPECGHTISGTDLRLLRR
jgi:hypothetical protein